MKKILTFFTALTLAFAIGGCKDELLDNGTDSGGGSGTGSGTGDQSESPTYKVGDYFYTSARRGGIVFSVDETGEHGYLLALDEIQAVWSYRDENVMDGVYANNGDYNCACVQALGGWRENYPGFVWAADKNVMINCWYIPSCTELALLYEAYTTAGGEDTQEAKAWFNSCLTENGGTPLRDVLYWSSEEMGVSNAYPFDMGSGMRHLSTADNYKSVTYPFRAICKF